MTVKFSKNQEIQKIQRNRKEAIQNIRRKTVNKKIVEREKIGDVSERRSTEALLEDADIAVIIQNLVECWKYLIVLKRIYFNEVKYI
jgi:hypothetical protein